MKKVLIWAFAALMTGTFALSSCSKDEESPETPASSGKARYTIMVYGNAGGNMDSIIENAWVKLKPMLTDASKVRMVFLYKYGGETDFTGQFADPGDVVVFELNSQTNLTKLRERAIQAPDFPLYEPEDVAGFIDTCKTLCPADKYIFLIFGHGGAFDVVNDYPDDVQAKGVLYDDLADGRGMSMYELADGLAASNTLFECIFFHNCLMGNIENLTQVRPYTNYFFCCVHVMLANSLVLPELLKATQNNNDFEQASGQFFRTLTPLFDNEVEEDPDGNHNLDMKMLRANEIDNLNHQIQLLATRLVELYPTQKEAIDNAADQIYRYDNDFPYLIDIDNYAENVADQTNDAQLRAIANEIHTIFDRAIFAEYKHKPFGDPDMDFTLSIVFGHNEFYNKTVHDRPISSAYAPSVFNSNTNWGNWLNTNTYWPEEVQGSEGSGMVDWDEYSIELDLR